MVTIAGRAKPVRLPENEPVNLSKQQREIYRLGRQGRTIQEIADALRTSRGTVDYQLRKIREKDYHSKNLTTFNQGDNYAQNTIGMDDQEFAELSGRQAQLMQLHQQGYKLKDAALAIGIKPETAYVMAHRARKALVSGNQGKHKQKVKLSYIKDLPKEEQDRIMAVEPERFDPDTAAFAFKTMVVKNERIGQEEMRALAREGLGGWMSKKALIGAHAKSFKVLAAGSRQTLMKVTDKGVRCLMADVLECHFSQLTEDTWCPGDGCAKETFYKELNLRLKLLVEQIKEALANGEELGDGVGVLVRRLLDGHPGVAVGARLQKRGIIGPVTGKGSISRTKDKYRVLVDGKGNVVDQYVYSAGKDCWVVSGAEIIKPGDQGEVIGTTLVVKNAANDGTTRLVRLSKFGQEMQERLIEEARKASMPRQCSL